MFLYKQCFVPFLEVPSVDDDGLDNDTTAAAGGGDAKTLVDVVAVGVGCGGGVGVRHLGGGGGGANVRHFFGNTGTRDVFGVWYTGGSTSESSSGTKFRARFLRETCLSTSDDTVSRSDVFSASFALRLAFSMSSTQHTAHPVVSLACCKTLACTLHRAVLFKQTAQNVYSSLTVSILAISCINAIRKSAVRRKACVHYTGKVIRTDSLRSDR